MSLFKKSDKIRNNIELVSLHIPKTAGTSFRNILKNEYGSSNVARLDIRKEIEVDGKVFSGSHLKTKTKVIHGHFPYQSLIERFQISDDCPVITWLRDPAERVISNYFYLDKMLRKELQGKLRNINMLARMEKTLLEYAGTEVNRNRMSKFLTGISPEEFYFIGIADFFEEDLEYLAKQLKWSNYSVLTQNITGHKEKVDEPVLQKIREFNSDDCDLYNRALEIRAKRIAPAT